MASLMHLFGTGTQKEIFTLSLYAHTDMHSHKHTPHPAHHQEPDNQSNEHFMWISFSPFPLSLTHTFSLSITQKNYLIFFSVPHSHTQNFYSHKLLNPFPFIFSHSYKLLYFLTPSSFLERVSPLPNSRFFTKYNCFYQSAFEKLLK